MHPTLQRIDLLCDAFENEWLSGKRPDIASHLAAADQRDRAALLVELLRMDLEYRRKQGEQPRVEDYLDRFGEYDTEVRRALGEHDATLADDAPPMREPHDAPTLMYSLGTLGDYRLLEKIGAGGMGDVYKAHHEKLQRVVAIKVLPREAMRHPHALRRFDREIRVVGALDHPNIVRTMDADEVDGTHFLVMEYVDGQDLSRRLKSAGPLPVSQAVDCIRQAARGLAYAHQQGVVHRDIKPANLLLAVGDRLSAVGQNVSADSRQPTADGLIVKILDLGLARLESEIAQHTSVHKLTRTDQVMGTFDYMSPEQAVQSRGVDHRTDIYSLGCTLYVLLTGQPIFAGGTSVEKVMAHRSQPAPALRDTRADVPAALEAVFQKMVAKQPDDRFATMDEVVAALDKIVVEDLPTAGVTTSVDQSATEIDDETVAFVQGVTQSPWWQGGLFTLAMAAAAAVVAMLGLLALIYAVRSPDSTTDGIQPQVTSEVADADPPAADPPAATANVFAPFDAAQAKVMQGECADFYNLPVTKLVDLGSGVQMSLVLIPPGEFLMGSNESDQTRWLEKAKATGDTDGVRRIQCESPQHPVEITRPFYLGTLEVTQRQWRAAMGDNLSKFQDDVGLPVEQVDWDDAQAHARKAQRVAGGRAEADVRAADRGPMGIRLPRWKRQRLSFRRQIGLGRLCLDGKRAAEIDVIRWNSPAQRLGPA